MCAGTDQGIDLRLGELLQDAGHDVVGIAASSAEALALGQKLAPDVAFISNERLPDPPPRGFAELAPDLAVEVLSPDDRPGEVLEKVGDWLNAGARLVWVVDPIRVLARVYRADGSESILDKVDSLHGENVWPGFEYPLSAIAR